MAWGVENQGVAAVSAKSPAPLRRYRAKIDTVAECANEMRRIYREARSNLISVESASKLSNMLAQIARTVETSDLEQRIGTLERDRQGGRP